MPKEDANLVVKGTGSMNNNTYTICDQGDSVSIAIPNNIKNIIIPKGITVNQGNVRFDIENNDSIINLIVLGTINNSNNQQSLFDFNKRANIIIGPNAKINCKNQAMFWFGESNPNPSSLVLYTGCTINMSSNYKDKYFIVGSTGTVYLNKYEYDPKGYDSTICKLIEGTIPENMKIVFPKENFKFNNTSSLSPFTNLYWNGSGHNMDNSMETQGSYSTASKDEHFTEYDVPLQSNTSSKK